MTLVDYMDEPYSLPIDLPPNIDQLISAAFSQSINNLSSQAIHDAYIDHSKDIGVQVDNGVVATPSYIADYMVVNSWRESGVDISKLSWYDPCVGSGVFVEAILKNSINSERVSNGKRLPCIRVSDVSPAAIYATLLIVRKTLENYSISSRDYIESENFKVLLGDSLERMQEQRSILDEGISSDVVIGNPPYVRGARISSDYKKKLKIFYPDSYNGNADLYYYFIVNGLNCLSENGILCFISPTSFLKAKSAYGLREYISRNSKLVKFLDLDETKVFRDVDLHAAIYWLRHGGDRRKENVSYCHLSKDEDLLLLKKDIVQYKKVKFFSNGSSGIAFNLKHSAIRANDKTIFLSQAGISLYSGIRPGNKAAFVRDKSEFEVLPNKLKRKWLKPAMSAKEISKWQTSFSDSRIIYIENESEDIPSEIERLLSPFKDSLSRRSEANKKNDWYKLRSCSYSNIFERKRIVFPDISSHSKFSLVTEAGINLDGSFVIDSDNLALLGILNSAPMWDYLVTICGSIGNAHSKGRLRVKKNFVEKVPFPREIFESSNRVNVIESLVLDILTNGETKKRHTHLTKLVANLYE